MKQTKNKQRNSWTKQEDDALIYIKEVLKVKKWSEVALKLMQIHNEHERKDKHCRDRYENFLVKSEGRKKAWTTQEEVKTIQYYMQYGNKWSQIATLFDETNGVYIKNKFYSRMRKGIRTINYLIDSFYMRNWKQLQLDIIFKLVTCAAEKFDLNSKNPISKKVEKKVTFVECMSILKIEIVYKIFMLSFVDKSKIKKSPKQSKQNTVSLQYIDDLMQEINFIDEHMEKKRTNRANPQSSQDKNKENGKKENHQNAHVKPQFQTKLEEDSPEREQYLGVMYEQKQNVYYQLPHFQTDKDIRNKQIKVIATNSFQKHYQNWINSHPQVKKQNNGENKYQGGMKKMIILEKNTNQPLSNTTTKICSYRQIHSSSQWGLLQGDQLLKQRQHEQKWHNLYNHDLNGFIE